MSKIPKTWKPAEMLTPSRVARSTVPSSVALARWETSVDAALSQLEDAYRAVGGTRSGRRTNTLQLNYAFVLLLSAHFQAFCRDLHSETVAHVRDVLDPEIGAVVSANLTLHRQLDSRNAQPGSIGTDFGRFGFELWPVVDALDARNPMRRRKLERLNGWRNAIAHHDIEARRPALDPSEVTLLACSSWRNALAGLARSFDRAVADRLHELLDIRPW
jgi:hypothetical protein